MHERVLSPALAARLASYSPSVTSTRAHYLLAAAVPAVIVCALMAPLRWLPEWDRGAGWAPHVNASVAETLDSGNDAGVAAMPTHVEAWAYSLLALPLAVFLGTQALGLVLASMADFRIAPAVRIAAGLVAAALPTGIQAMVAELAKVQLLPFAAILTATAACWLFWLVVLGALPRHDRSSRAIGAMWRYVAHVCLAGVWWAAVACLVTSALAGIDWAQVAAYAITVPTSAVYLALRCDAIVAVAEPDVGSAACLLPEHISSVATAVMYATSASSPLVLAGILCADLARQAYAVMALSGAARRLRLTALRFVRVALHSARDAWGEMADALRRCRLPPALRAATVCGSGARVTPAHQHHRGRGRSVARVGAVGGRRRGARPPVEDLSDDGEAQITPARFNLICMLYEQKPPKMFGQYDAKTVKREQLRKAVWQVTVQHSRVAGVLQTLLLGAGAVLLGLGGTLQLPHAAGLGDAAVAAVGGELAVASAAALEAEAFLDNAAWGLAVALSVHLGAAWAARSYIHSRFAIRAATLLQFEQVQRRGMPCCLQACALAAVVLLGLCWRSGADATLRFHWL